MLFHTGRKITDRSADVSLWFTSLHVRAVMPVMSVRIFVLIFCISDRLIFVSYMIKVDFVLALVWVLANH